MHFRSKSKDENTPANPNINTIIIHNNNHLGSNGIGGKGDFFNMADMSNIDNFQKRIGDAETAFKTNEVFTDAINGINNILVNVLEAEFPPEFETQQNFFVQKGIPKLVHAIQTRQTLNQAMLPHVMKFFEKVFDLIIMNLVHDNVELLEVLDWLFNMANPFYAKFGIYNRSPALLQEDLKRFAEREDKIKASENGGAVPGAAYDMTWSTNFQTYVFASPQTKAQKNMSAYFIRNINYFGQRGGFTALMDRLSTQTPPLTFSIIKRLLRPFVKVMDGLNRSFLNEFVPTLQNKIVTFILEVDDETLRTEDKSSYMDIVALLHEMLKKYKPKEANEIIEKLCLQIYLMCFNSKYLEKRLSGLADIKDVIKDTCQEDFQRKSNNTLVSNFRYISAANSAPESQRFVTTKFLIKWLQTQKVIECIFGDNIHIELVKQSKHILLFLAAEKALTNDHLDAIWNAAVDNHESLKRAIYEVIIEVTQNLGIACTNYLYEKIEQSPLSKLDVQTLDFVKDFTVEAIINNMKVNEKKKKWYGMELFFRLMQDNSGVSSDISNKAFDCMVQLVKKPECESQRKSILKRCVAKLRDGESVPQSLSMITIVIDTFPQTKRKKKNSVWGIIDNLNEKYKLLDSFFVDLARYKDRAAAEFKAMPDKSGDEGSQHNSENNDLSDASSIGDTPFHSRSDPEPDIESIRNMAPPQQHQQQDTDGDEDPLNVSNISISELAIDIPDNPLPATAENERPTTSESKESVQSAGKESKQGNTPMITVESATPKSAANTPASLFYRYSHTKQIEIRLKFLTYILSNSSILLSYAQATKMWDLLYDRALSNEEKNAFISWLEVSRSLNESGFEAFSDEVTEKLFNDRIMHLKPRTMTEREFSLFYTFFTYINLRQGNLEAVMVKIRTPQSQVPRFGQVQQVQITTTTRIRVKSNELKGISYLWELALKARNAKVGLRAIEYLNNLRHEYSRDLLPFAPGYRELHIDECLKLLTEASKTVANDADEAEERQTKIERCIQLLLDYVALFDPKSIARGQRASLGIPVLVKVHVINGPKFKLTVQSTDNIKRLGQFISAELGHPYKYLRLFTDGKEIESDESTLEELNFSDEQLVVVLKRDFKDVAIESVQKHLNALGLNQLNPLSQRKDKPDEKSEKTIALPAAEENVGDSAYVILQLEDEKSYPAYILSKDKYFQQLLGMLDNGDQTAEQVWKLLMSLPTNESMSNALRELNISGDSVSDWNKLINNNSVYRLLYALQIIDQLRSKKDDQFDINAWSIKFVQHGGVLHLLGILFSKNAEQFSKGPLHKQCLSLLLKTINWCLPVSFGRGDKAIKANDMTQIVDTVLKIVSSSLIMTEDGEVNDIALDVFPEKPEKPGTPGIAGVLGSPKGSPIMSPKRFISREDTDTESEPDTPSKKNASSAPDRAVVEQAMALLLTAVSLDGRILRTVYSHPSLKEWVRNSLFRCENEVIRKEIATGLNRLLSSYQHDNSNDSPKAFFIPFLFGFINEVDKYWRTCGEYFSLLADIFNYGTKDSITKHFDSKKALRDLLQMLIDRPVLESRAICNQDSVLAGLLRITRVLLRANPDMKPEVGKPDATGNGILHHVFRFLFEVPTSENHGEFAPPKCKSKEARQAAFGLLSEMADGCDTNFELVCSLVVPLFSKCDRSPGWDFSPSGFDKSSFGFVGLKNQGATCYMNSLIQQFFNIRPFRKGIFSVLTDPTQDDESMLLYQLQKLFGYLQESEKRYYDPYEFCAAYKDFDGKPINVLQQQDANEFFNLLFDRIEKAMKHSKEANLLKDIFEGKLLSQIISDECPMSEREEPFFTVSLEVQNKRNIQESLELYTQGEILDGENKYYSDVAKKHVRALKRTCFKDLPKIMVCHLKRFEFDFQRMRNVKINDRCEFPMRLNMEPYTAEGLARRENRDVSKYQQRDKLYYQYELIGVLVHTGTADSGHYYSFIKDLSKSDDPTNPQEVWYEFNDIQVKAFNVKDIPKECFGGVEEVAYKEDKQTMQRKFYRANNAYLLFYRRLDTSPLLNPQPQPQPHHDRIPSPPITPITPIMPLIGREEDDSIIANKILTDIVTTPANDRCNNNNNISSNGSGNGNGHANGKKFWQRSKSILALKFIVKLSAMAKRRDIELSRDSGMPVYIKELVWKDNMRFLYNKVVYNSEFEAFLWDLVSKRRNSSNEDLSQLTAELAARFLVDIMIHYRDKSSINHWIQFLNEIFSKSEKCSRWFLATLASQSTWLQDIFISCPFPDIRASMVSLVICCIKVLSPKENYFPEESVQPPAQEEDLTMATPSSQQQAQPYSATNAENGNGGSGGGSDTHNSKQEPSTSEDDSSSSALNTSENLIVPDDQASDGEESSVVVAFIDAVLELLTDNRLAKRSSTELFQLLKEFAEIGQNERKYLIKKQVISSLVIMINAAINDKDASSATLPSPYSPAVRLGPASVFGKQSFSYMLSLTSLLVRSCATSVSKTHGPPPSHVPGPEYELSMKDRSKFFNKTFFAMVIHEGVNTEAVSEILLHWCWESKSVSINFATLIINKLVEVPHENYEPYFQILGNLLDIRDSVRERRIKEVLQHFIQQVMSNMKNSTSTFACVKFISKHAIHNEEVKAWLYDHMKELEHICEYHGWSLKHNKQ